MLVAAVPVLPVATAHGEANSERVGLQHPAVVLVGAATARPATAVQAAELLAAAAVPLPQVAVAHGGTKDKEGAVASHDLVVAADAPATPIRPHSQLVSLQDQAVMLAGLVAAAEPAVAAATTRGGAKDKEGAADNHSLAAEGTQITPTSPHSQRVGPQDPAVVTVEMTPPRWLGAHCPATRWA